MKKVLKIEIDVIRTSIYKDGGFEGYMKLGYFEGYMKLGYKATIFSLKCVYKEVKFGSWKMNINDFN